MNRLFTMLTLFGTLLGNGIACASDVDQVEKFNDALAKLPDTVADCAYKISGEDDDAEKACREAFRGFPTCFGTREQSGSLVLSVPIKTWEKTKKFVLLDNQDCQMKGQEQSEALKKSQSSSNCPETNAANAARSLDLEGRPMVTEQSDPKGKPSRDYVAVIPARRVGPLSNLYKEMTSKVTQNDHVLISKYFMLDGEMGFGVVQNTKTCQLSILVTNLMQHYQFASAPLQLSPKKLTFTFKLYNSEMVRTIEIDNDRY